MHTSFAQLAALNAPVLAGVLRPMFGDDAVAVDDWWVHDLRHRATAPMSGGLYRIAGNAYLRGTRVPWTVMLKLTRPWPGQTPQTFPEGWDPGHHCYWKREPLFYASNMLSGQHGAVAAPRCYGVWERSGEDVWIWLEELSDAAPGRWPASRYRQTARHLGEFNGRYLLPHSLPEHPWLNHHCLRTLSAPRPAIVALIRRRETWEDPLVRQTFPTPVAGSLLQLMADRDHLLTAVEGLPRTLCHHDTHRANLFLRTSHGREQTGAIDWAQVGTGAIGEDLVQLVMGCVIDHEVSPADVPELQASLVAGYVDGLRFAGWDGAEHLARLGFTAALALRSSMNALELTLLPALDPIRRREAEAQSGRSIADCLRQRSGLVYQALAAADAARALLTAMDDRGTPRRQ